MDPSASLRMIRDLVVEILDDENSGEREYNLACEFADLDEWLHRGGFLPVPWKEAR